MKANVVLNGSLRLKKGSTWRGQHDLEDLSLVNRCMDSEKCGLYTVSFTVESVIPLHTVKLYSLTRQRYHAFTKSPILSDFLSQVYKPMSTFQQPKYALLICIRSNGIAPANPFDDNETIYPLPKESYVLLIGRKCGEQSQDAMSLQVFAQVLRDRFDYPNFYNLSHAYDLTVAPSFTFGDHKIDNDSDDSNQRNVAESILRSYRHDIVSTAQQHEQENHHRNSSNLSYQHRHSWKSLLKKDMDRLGKLDQLRDESRRSRPERTLTVVKRKHLPTRKSSNVAPPPLPSTLKKSASASAFLHPSKSLKRQPSLPTHPSSQQSTKTNIPAASSSSQQQSSNSESSYYDANKKQLKSAVWSKLLQVGHNKKSDDTKQLFHCIYQSMQYTLRKSFKSEPLDSQLMDSQIDSHIRFYSSLELPNDHL